MVSKNSFQNKNKFASCSHQRVRNSETLDMHFGNTSGIDFGVELADWAHVDPS